MTSPTPAPSLSHQARELSDRALALRTDIAALHDDLRDSDGEPIRRLNFRLTLALGDALSISTQLLETAEDLDRVDAARAPGNCTIPWGVCPAHGNTLVSSGGECWCKLTICPRRWRHDRAALPCNESAVWIWTDPQGATAQICEGHAIPIRNELGAEARLAPIRAASQR